MGMTSTEGMASADIPWIPASTGMTEVGGDPPVIPVQTGIQ